MSAAPGAGRLEFFRFLAVGGFAAGVNVGTRFAFNVVVSYPIAVVLAYGCGMVTAFFLNRRFVFAPSNLTAHTQFVRFTMINLLALAQVWVISVGLAEWVFPHIGFGFHPLTVAHLAGVSAPVLTSYLGHKRFSFGHAPGAPSRT